jgi:hypothetical protein
VVEVLRNVYQECLLGQGRIEIQQHPGDDGPGGGIIRGRRGRQVARLRKFVERNIGRFQFAAN